MAKTTIEWTEAVWNPTQGCTIVSPGCKHCYAMRMAHRLQHNPKIPRSGYRGVTKKSKAGPVWTGRVNMAKTALLKPLRWRKPRLIFVNSMSDVFHENLTSAQIARVWAVMAIAKQHTYQVLTKRPRKMLEWLSDPATRFTVELAMRAINPTSKLEAWPLPNVWCGASVEDGRRAKERIPVLLQVPAAVRFLSMEPLLGKVDLGAILKKQDFKKLDWVIVGGESGPKARPMHPTWARDIRDACLKSGVGLFFKQIGSWAWVSDRKATHWMSENGQMFDVPMNGCQGMRYGSKKSGGRKLDGQLWQQMPDPRSEGPMVSQVRRKAA
jgi:protein gp37